MQGKEKRLSKMTTFVTITGLQHHLEAPVLPGALFKCIKEPQNKYDDEAIRVELPGVGKAGYIANQWRTVARGTYSSGRLYDKVGEVSFAEVKFSLGNTVICQVLEGDEQEVAPRYLAQKFRSVVLMID
jgi:hypothetical protein